MIQPTIRLRIGASILACLCGVIYILLGHAVTTGPPLALDAYGATLAGTALPFAWIATNSGLFPELTAIGVITLIVGLRYRAWLPRAVFAVIIDVVAWLISDAAKHYFQRARPSHWYYHQETSFSYSSGHAMHAVIVYGLWAYFLWQSSLPRILRICATASLSLWVLAVSWSRLALGVHYMTDVIGGWLLAIVILSLGFALRPQLFAKLHLHEREVASNG